MVAETKVITYFCSRLPHFAYFGEKALAAWCDIPRFHSFLVWRDRTLHHASHNSFVSIFRTPCLFSFSFWVHFSKGVFYCNLLLFFPPSWFPSFWFTRSLFSRSTHRGVVGALFGRGSSFWGYAVRASFEAQTATPPGSRGDCFSIFNTIVRDDVKL
jgi:hypothetical protein